MQIPDRYGILSLFYACSYKLCIGSFLNVPSKLHLIHRGQIAIDMYDSAICYLINLLIIKRNLLKYIWRYRSKT